MFKYSCLRSSIQESNSVQDGEPNFPTPESRSPVVNVFAVRAPAELRPSVLDDLGLAAAIEWQLLEFQARTRIHCVLEPTAGRLGLSRDDSTNAFRIFQELLTNVARHANARTVTVSVKQEERHVVLEVRDDGRGITRRQIEAPESLGLLGLQERVMRMGGHLKIQGRRGKGTSVTLRVPLSGREDTGR